jgi:hypothetical protein
MIYNESPQGPEQRTEEWYSARLGVVTGSRVINTMDFAKPTKTQINKASKFYEERGISSEAEGEVLARLLDEYPFEYVLRAGIELKSNGKRATMLKDLVGERLTHLPADPEPFVNYEMKWGIVNEPASKLRYQLTERKIVLEMPLMPHPTLPWCAVSPDGAIKGENGGVEFKNPRTGTHLTTLKSEIIEEDKYIPEEYFAQVQLEIDGNDWDWVDFVSHDNRLPRHLQYMCHRIPRDDFYIHEVMRPNIVRFNAEVEREIEYFNNYRKSWYASQTDKKKAEAENAPTDTDSSKISDEQPTDSGADTSEQSTGIDRLPKLDPSTTTERIVAAKYREHTPGSRLSETNETSDSNSAATSESIPGVQGSLPASSAENDAVLQSEDQSATELDDIYIDITDEELRDDITEMFKLVQMSSFDQRRTIRDVGGVISLDKLKHNHLIDLHKKLSKWLEIIGDGNTPDDLPKSGSASHIENVSEVFGEQTKLIN